MMCGLNRIVGRLESEKTEVQCFNSYIDSREYLLLGFIYEAITCERSGNYGGPVGKYVELGSSKILPEAIS